MPTNDRRDSDAPLGLGSALGAGLGRRRRTGLPARGRPGAGGVAPEPPSPEPPSPEPPSPEPSSSLAPLPGGSPSEFAPGLRIRDRYELRARVADVEFFDAFDHQAGATVAVQVFPSPAREAAPRTDLPRLRALRRLRHPRIVRTLDVGECDQGLFRVVEPTVGPRVRDHLDGARSEPDLREATRIAIGVAEAIAVVHAAGLRGGVEPSNVLLCGEQREVKLFEVGLAPAAGQPSTPVPGYTDARGACYLAPELVLGQPATTAADLWALGALLFEATTGALPFEASDLPGVLDAIVKRDPPRPRDLNPALPAELERIVLDLLAKDPQRRPSRAPAIAKRLRRLYLGVRWDVPKRPQSV